MQAGRSRVPDRQPASSSGPRRRVPHTSIYKYDQDLPPTPPRASRPGFYAVEQYHLLPNREQLPDGSQELTSFRQEIDASGRTLPLPEGIVTHGVPPNDIGDERDDRRIYGIGHIRHANNWLDDPPFEKPEQEFDAILRTWVTFDSRFWGQVEALPVTVKFRALYEKQHRSATLEGSQLFRIPNCADDSIFKDQKWRLTVVLQSHVRRGHGSTKFCWGPDVAIRYIKVALENDLRHFPNGYEHALEGEDFLFDRKRLARDTLMMAAKKLTILPVALFVNDCTCGERVGKGCPFCKGEQAPEYHRVDPLLKKDEPECVPMFPFEQEGQTVEEFPDVRMPDDFNFYGTPPDYSTPVEDLERKFNEIKAILGGRHPEMRDVFMTIIRNLIEALSTRKNWQVMKEAGEMLDLASDSMAAELEHAHKTSDALATVDSLISSVWRDMENSKPEMTDWTEERSWIDKLVNIIAIGVLRPSPNMIPRLHRAQPCLLMTEEVVDRANSLRLVPKNFDHIKNTRRLVRKSKTAIENMALADRRQPSQPTRFLRNGQVQRVISLPCSCKSLVHSRTLPDHRMSALQLSKLFSNEIGRRMALRKQSEDTSTLFHNHLFDRLYEDAEAIATLIREMNYLPAKPMKHIRIQEIYWAICAHRDSINAVAQFISEDCVRKYIKPLDFTAEEQPDVKIPALRPFDTGPLDWYRRVLPGFCTDTWRWVENTRPGLLEQALSSFPFDLALRNSADAADGFHSLVFVPIANDIRRACNYNVADCRTHIGVHDDLLAQEAVLVLPEGDDHGRMFFPPVWLVLRLYANKEDKVDLGPLWPPRAQTELLVNAHNLQALQT